MSDVTLHDENGYPEGFNRDDPKAGYLFAVTGTIILILIAAVSFVIFYYRKAEDAQEVVKLQIPIDQDSRQLHAEEKRELTHYGFINKEKGIVRLPIERAMQLLIEENAAGKYPFPTQPYATKPLTGPDQPAAQPAAAASAAPAGH